MFAQLFKYTSNAVYLLTMSGHPIFVRVDRNGVHRELMGGTEYADGDFLEMVGKMVLYASSL